VTLRIGAGAGYAGDRLEPALEMVTVGAVDYLVFECLAERTIAIFRAQRAADPSVGFGDSLEARLSSVLPSCVERGTRIVSNLGAANPLGAQRLALEIAARGDFDRPVSVAAVTGDDVLDRLADLESVVWETGERVCDVVDRVEWAHAYLGAETLLPALTGGADVTLGGRIADPSLFVAPMVAEFGWALDDWVRLGKGTAAGHLLECSAAVTGGYFADPGRKDVEGLADIGFPLVEIDESGDAVITKPAGSGGQVSIRTCKEQILYEINDPSAYLTPDVTADFSAISFHADGPDRVLLRGASGKPRPEELKVVLGMHEGFIGEGEMSYAGRGCVQRARQSAEIMRERLPRFGIRPDDIHVEIVGQDALLGPIGRRSAGPEVLDVRLRVAARALDRPTAQRVGFEVEALSTTGPAGGGGKRSSVKQVVAVYSTTIPRGRLDIRTSIERV
jgi:hypothetical protein